MCRGVVASVDGVLREVVDVFQACGCMSWKVNNWCWSIHGLICRIESRE